MPRSLAPRPAPLLAAAGLFLLAAAALGPGLLPGRTLLPLDILGLFEPWRGELPEPRNPEVGDAVLQFAQRELRGRALAAGHVPLWHTGIMGGHPLAGDTHSSPFNPLEMALIATLPAQSAYSLQMLLQLWLAGLFMALWIRQLGPSWFPALAGAITWMFAGYQQVFRSFLPFGATTMWLPAVVAAWEHAARTGQRRWTALGGLAAGAAILGGQLQFVAYGAVVLLVYGSVRTAGFDTTRRRRALGSGMTIGALGLAIAAVHLLPAVELTRDLVREPFSITSLADTAVPLRQLITLVAPAFLGDPRTDDYRGAQNFPEMMLYIGLVPLLVVITAPLLRRDGAVWLLAVLAGLVASIALGSPLAWPQAWLPGLSYFGLMRWLAAWPLVAAPLVALGLAAAAADPRRFARLVAGAALGLAGWLVAVAWADPEGADAAGRALIWLAGSAAALVAWSRHPGRRMRQALVLGVLVADLLAFGVGYTPSARLADAFPLLPPMDRLAAERADEVFRVVVLQPDHIALGPGVAASVGLDEIGGYTSTPRASFRTFVDRLSRPTGNGFLADNPNLVTVGQASPLLMALLNVRYALSATPLEAFDLPLDPQAGCQAKRALAAGETIGTAVAPWADGFNRVDVAAARGGRVAVHVVEAPGADEHLAYGELEAGAGARAGAGDGAEAGAGDGDGDGDGAGHGSGSVRTLYFEPIADSGRRTFYVYVDRPTGATGPPPEVCVVGGALAVGLGAVEAGLAQDGGANGLYVYRAPEPPGRAWIVPVARPAGSQAEALDAVAAAGFDPRAEVVVEPPTGGVLPDVVEPRAGGVLPEVVAAASESSSRRHASAQPTTRLPAADASTSSDAGSQRSDRVPADPGEKTPGAQGVTSVADDGPNVRRIALDAPAGGWLVVSEAFAPGWRATVDGLAAPVLRADGGIQAVPLGPGSRSVTLTFRPWSVVAGAWISALGVVAAFGLAWWPARPPISAALGGDEPRAEDAIALSRSRSPRAGAD